MEDNLSNTSPDQGKPFVLDEAREKLQSNNKWPYEQTSSHANNAKEDSTPFSLKKAFLAIWKFSWKIIKFTSLAVWWGIRAAWWITRFVWFFVLVFWGIVTGIFSMSSRSSATIHRYDGEPEWRYRRRIEEINEKEQAQYKHKSKRSFAAAGRIWKGLWGINRDE